MRSFAFRSLLPHNIWSKPNTSVIIIETLFICIKGVWIYQESRLSKYWQPLVNFQTFLYVMLLCGLQCFFCKFCSAGSLFFFSIIFLLIICSVQRPPKLALFWGGFVTQHFLYCCYCWWTTWIEIEMKTKNNNNKKPKKLQYLQNRKQFLN